MALGPTFGPTPVAGPTRRPTCGPTLRGIGIVDTTGQQGHPAKLIRKGFSLSALARDRRVEAKRGTWLRTTRFSHEASRGHDTWRRSLDIDSGRANKLRRNA
jgi:hypothetical protein